MSVMNVVGRLGRDVTLRYTQNNDAVADLAVVYDYGRKGNDGKRPTQWVRASMWGRQAERLAPHLLKGTAVELTLSDVHVRQFQKNDGTSGVSLEGRVIHFDFPPASAGGGQQNQQHSTAPQQPAGGMDSLGGDVPFRAYFARNAYCI